MIVGMEIVYNRVFFSNVLIVFDRLRNAYDIVGFIGLIIPMFCGKESIYC